MGTYDPLGIGRSNIKTAKSLLTLLVHVSMLIRFLPNKQPLWIVIGFKYILFFMMLFHIVVGILWNIFCI